MEDQPKRKYFKMYISSRKPSLIHLKEIISQSWRDVHTDANWGIFYNNKSKCSLIGSRSKGWCILMMEQVVTRNGSILSEKGRLWSSCISYYPLCKTVGIPLIKCTNMQREMSKRVFIKMYCNSNHLWDVGFQVIFIFYFYFFFQVIFKRSLIIKVSTIRFAWVCSIRHL